MQNNIVNTSFLGKYGLKISLYASLFILIFTASNVNWGGKNWEDILEADAKGYYAYLPAVFIYQDLNFEFFEEIEHVKYPNKNLFYDYRHSSKGRNFNKYYCGTAIAELPLFLLAHALTKLSGGDADGYSKLYLVSINFGAILYLFLACIYIIKILRKYKIRDSIIAILIPVMIFSSNLLVYAVMDPGMSHIYSLAFFSIFIYQALSYFEKPEKKYLIKLAALLGIIILIRPSNALIILSIPMLAGSMERLKNGFAFMFQYPGRLLLAALLSFSIISIQLLAYRAATGSFFVYSYAEERFYFNSPHILEILFSYRRGFFLYSPVFFLGLIGYRQMYAQNKFMTLSHFTFLSVVIYILSCWWIWWYGGGFSCRIFVEFIPFFILPLAMLLQANKPLWQNRLLYSFLLIFVIVAQIQIYQYRHYQIHWENTTKQMYWENFLRIDKLI